LPESIAIPREAAPGQVVFDRGVELGADAGVVDILEPQGEAPAREPGEVVGNQGREGVAEVEGAGGAGREARRHGRVI
jgi:hypothetical protein